MMMLLRLWIMLLAAAPATSTASAPTTAPAAKVHLLYRGIQPGDFPPAAVDQHHRSFAITGMSGITYAGGSTFWVVLDNSDKAVCLDITFKDDCSIRRVKPVAGITLDARHDYEGIAIADAKQNIAYLSDEDTPAVHRVDLTTGSMLGDLPLPPVFRQIMRNQGLESLTISPDHKTLWTANERALLIDGNLKAPAEPFGSTTRVRLQSFDLSGDRPRPTGQFVYQTSGVHQLGGQIGLCDLAALPDGRLLALERSAGEAIDGKRSIRTRIFLVNAAAASDVGGHAFDEGLKDKPLVKVFKTPLYDGLVFDDDGENLEGLCLGPQVSKNRWIVLGCVDDGDGIHVSKPRIVAFELLLPSAP